MEGYEKLKEAVMNDCNKGQGCFNPDGCNHEFTRIVPSEGAMKQYSDKVCKMVSDCTHKYCDKFKWVIDRAKHYAEKLGVDYNEILNGWEQHRSYWYMNYYQDSNQPEIKGDKYRVFETVEALKSAVGNEGFRCPVCGEKSTDAYACNSGKIKDGKACDWKVYGVFGDLGRGVFVYCKDKLMGQQIFMPIAWEKENKEPVQC